MPPKWPHDHADKHARAARKGWARRRASGDIAKFGGSSAHTEKTHYLKERKKAAPKKATPAKAAPDTFQLIATQKANGKWIVSKLYKSGRIAQEPREYASNPLGKKATKAKTARGQSALFGGDYEREKTYGRGLF